MHRADPRPKMLIDAGRSPNCFRNADPALRDQHGPERKAEDRSGVQGCSPDTPFLTQAKKYSVFYLFCLSGADHRRVA